MKTGRRWLALIVCASLPVLNGCPNTNTTDWESRTVGTQSSTAPVAVRVADIDNDGRKDVVSAWKGTDSGTTGAVVIDYQEADGTWTSAIIKSATAFANVHNISLADMNSDGHLDILVASNDRLTYLQSPTDPRITGEWKALDIQESIRADYKQWYDVAAAQIDGKNGLDLVATLKGVGRLVWFAAPDDPNSDTGWTFKSIDSTTRSGADSIQLVDMDGNGQVDVVCSATGDTSNVISWYEHPVDLENDTWSKHRMTKYAGATRFTFGDVDGDGAQDLIAISPSARTVAWFPRPSAVRSVWDGWLMVNYTKSTSDERVPVDVAVADINNDGQQDVVVACSKPGGVFWYTPGSTIQALWTSNRVAAISDITVGFSAADDIDGNGLVDVIAPIDHATDESLDRVNWFVNPGVQ